MMEIQEDNSDIYLNQNGQPVSDNMGNPLLIENSDCWLQDIWLEALTEERELFYENEDGRECYGWSLLDFIQTEYDEFTEIEIQQRIKSKLSKRTFIDARSIKSEVRFRDGRYYVKVQFARNDDRAAYNLDITIDKVEVTIK